MDTRQLLDACSTSSIPYRYDLGPGRDGRVSYFVDNGLTQGFLGGQDSGTSDHESLSVTEAQAGITSERSGNVLP